MANGIQFGPVASYLVYFSSVFIATIFAHLSGKYSYKKNNGEYGVYKPFWILSFFSLFVPLAFRGYGVDYENYIGVYNNVKIAGTNYFSYYTGMPEPLFALLNYIVAKLFDNYQWVFIISAFISLGLLYLSFSRYVKKVSLGMLIWTFGFTYYLFMYGLVRISLAIGITSLALKYLESREKYKYFLLIFLATLFHYSAIVMIPVFYMVSLKSNPLKTKKRVNILLYTLLLAATIPIIFALIKNVFPIIFDGYSWFARYNMYFNFEKDLRILKNISSMLPLLIIVYMYKEKFTSQIEFGAVYIKLFLIMVAFVIMSVFFPIHRVSYYLYPAAFYLYASFGKLKFNKNDRKIIIITYNYSMFILGVLWMIIAIFGSSLWEPYLIPYYLDFPF